MYLVKRLANIINEHRLALVCSLAMAFVIISPSIIVPMLAGDSYKGVNIGHWTDYAVYVGKGREILEGHGLGNPPLKIGKEKLADPHKVYIDYLLLWPWRVLGLAEFAKDNITIIYDLIIFQGVFLLVLSVYFFIYNISDKNKLLSSAIAALMVGGYTLVNLYHKVPSEFDSQYNMFVRPTMPLYGLFMLFVYFNALIISLRSQKRGSTILAAIIFGSLFYVYPYTWSFASVVTGLLFIFYLLLKDKKNVKKIFLVAVLGGIIGLNTLLTTFSFFHSSEAGKQVMYFAGKISHMPAPFGKLSFLVLILLVIFSYFNKKNKNLPILYAIVLSCWVVMNQQIITGKELEKFHYYLYFVIPMSVVVGGYLAWEMFLIISEKYKAPKKIGTFCLIALIIISFLNAGRQQYRGTVVTMKNRLHAQYYGPIFAALKKDKNSGVVLTSEAFFGKYVNVFTDHDLFWSDTAYVYNTPYQRILDAFYVYSYLDKESRNDFKDQMLEVDKNSTTLFKRASHFPAIYQYLAGMASKNYGMLEYNAGIRNKDPEVIKKRDENLEVFFNEYLKLTKNSDGIINILKNAEVNYIIWDKNKNPEWDLAVLPNLEEIVVSGDVYLYKLEY